MTDVYAGFSLRREFLDYAHERALGLPEYDYSHRKLQANFVGCIGEIAFAEHLKVKGIRFTDDRHETTHDFLISGHITLDVKTKDRTVRPELNYENSVPLYNHAHQRPNFYYFVSLLRDRRMADTEVYRFTHAFILGGIGIDKLEEKGKVWQAGETDPANGTTFWTSCINVTMADLTSNKEMMQIFKDAE